MAQFCSDDTITCLEQSEKHTAYRNSTHYPDM